MPPDTAQDAVAVRQPVSVIVCDLEGTVAPVEYVQQVLFPYARQRLATWLQAHAGELRVAQLLAEVAAEAGQPLDLAAAASQLLAWSDADRKIAPLKTLQGWIWQQGYTSGELQAPLYPDVEPALQVWRAQGRVLAVYSSGSVAAQQLFLGHSNAGDLRPLFGHWFDTAVGGKLHAASYRAIASQLQRPAAQLLFLSDHPGEIAAARAAGWQAIQVVRNSTPAPGAIASFAELAGALGCLPQPVSG